MNIIIAVSIDILLVNKHNRTRVVVVTRGMVKFSIIIVRSVTIIMIVSATVLDAICITGVLGVRVSNVTLTLIVRATVEPRSASQVVKASLLFNRRGEGRRAALVGGVGGVLSAGIRGEADPAAALQTPEFARLLGVGNPGRCWSKSVLI